MNVKTEMTTNDRLKHKIMKHLSAVLFLLCAFPLIGSAGETTSRDKKKVVIIDPSAQSIYWSGIGVGAGMDYGGFGANYTGYVKKNIGIFAGAGYAYAGFGYNFGMKLRMIPRKNEPKLFPFAMGMWGYNSAYTSDQPSLSEVWQGFTVGIGTDYRTLTTSKGYWSVAVLAPFHSRDAKDYKDWLEENVPGDYQTWVHSVGFSIGYHWIIRGRK